MSDIMTTEYTDELLKELVNDLYCDGILMQEEACSVVGRMRSPLRIAL